MLLKSMMLEQEKLEDLDLPTQKEEKEALWQLIKGKLKDKGA